MAGAQAHGSLSWRFKFANDVKKTMMKKRVMKKVKELTLVTRTVEVMKTVMGVRRTVTRQ